jgi:hypothetical protein
MGSSFLLPRCGCLVRGPKEAKNPAGENVRRLIQIRSATPSFEQNLAFSSSTIPASASWRFEFLKSSQLSIHTHNETLSVAAMRTGNRDCSRLGIND